jgi:alpha-beta hydrolase superfamily lysophospholipase
MRVLQKDEMFDSQLLRAIGHMYEHGADYGECYSTATRILSGETESWFKEWNSTATRIETMAEIALKNKHRQSAHESYLRASMYHRASAQFLIGSPDDKRGVDAYTKTQHCFIEAMKLSDTVNCEYVQIPYKDELHLPAYFLMSQTTDRAGQTIIVNGGYDSTKEECYFFAGAAALRRGFNVLLFDGPGQGLTLLEQKVHTVPDWESVMAPVVDYLHSRREVNKTKIAAYGISLGGYQVPRAVTKEKRIAAIIVDPAQISVGAKGRARLPLPQSWRQTFPVGVPWPVVSLVKAIVARRASNPSQGWPLRRIQHVHGLEQIDEHLFEELDKYVLDPTQVTCPTFVSFADKDEIAIEAKEFFEKCGAEKKVVVEYKEEFGSGEHCECGNRSSMNADCFNWLEELWA